MRPTQNPSFLSKANTAIIFTAVLCVLLFHPQNSWAQGTTSADFLELPRPELERVIRTSMALMSTIAALENQERGACILNWFFNEEPDQKMDLVFRAMERYADSSPPRLFVAVVEASSGCGKFPRSPEGQE